MAYSFFQIGTLLLGASLVLTAPVSLVPRQGTFSTLATADVDKFRPLTFFASTAYCSAAQTKDWSCGGTMIVKEFLERHNLTVWTLLSLQPTAMLIPTFNPQRLVAMVMTSNSGTWDLTQTSVYALHPCFMVPDLSCSTDRYCCPSRN